MLRQSVMIWLVSTASRWPLHMAATLMSCEGMGSVGITDRQRGDNSVLMALITNIGSIIEHQLRDRLGARHSTCYQFKPGITPGDEVLRLSSFYLRKSTRL